MQDANPAGLGSSITGLSLGGLPLPREPPDEPEITGLARLQASPYGER